MATAQTFLKAPAFLAVLNTSQELSDYPGSKNKKELLVQWGPQDLI